MRVLSKAAVVIPIYKEELGDFEKISLAQVRKILRNYPIIFVAPDDKNFSYIEPGEMLVQFHPQHFRSVMTYSQLLLQPFFYEPFLSFDYILIYHLDAFVFYDALEDFCRLGYDYIGAVWPRHLSTLKIDGKTPLVGNGGFCLRKVKACHELLQKLKPFPNWQNIFKVSAEDGVFAVCGMLEDKNFHVAPVEVADCFSMEYRPDHHVKRLGGELPFGCHGWMKFSADLYTEIFARFGYDLRPFKNQMRTENYELFLPHYLKMQALNRLIHRIEHGKSILQSLPIKKFDSVRVIRSPEAVKILAKLLTEENSLADKIFIYDQKNIFDLIDDVKKETLPHLIIAWEYDELLIEKIEDKNVVSFRQEYLKVQEKLFHNLGR